MHNAQSPRTDDQGIEAIMQAKGLTKPRITPDAIEANIRSEHYFTAEEGVIGAMPDDGSAQSHPCPDELSLLTFCVLILRNGFTVVGKSAVASPENFDADIGRRVARQDAINQCGPLMGYQLKSELAALTADDVDRNSRG